MEPATGATRNMRDVRASFPTTPAGVTGSQPAYLCGLRGILAAPRRGSVSMLGCRPSDDILRMLEVPPGVEPGPSEGAMDLQSITLPSRPGTICSTS